MMRSVKRVFFLLLSIILLGSCEGFFGEKTDQEFLGTPEFQVRQVAYVPITPYLDNFIRPVDVMIGFDDLIYVVDGSGEQIICYDLGRREVGRFTLQGVNAVMQNNKLDLYALGRVDTTINNVNQNVAALYKLDLYRDGSGISNPVVELIAVHPFYALNSTSSNTLGDVKFNKIALSGNGRYYITRSGPSDNNNALLGPDDAVIGFNSDDEYTGFINVRSREFGNSNDFFQNPSGIISYNNPPQQPIPDDDIGFIYTSLDPNIALKVAYINFINTNDDAFYQVTFPPAPDTVDADGYIAEPFKFEQPTDITLTNDGTNFLFITDAGTDSLYQFTVSGAEGVPPPPGSLETKNIFVGFGGTGNGLTQFNNPSGVAYLNRIVYVADTDNGRVSTFQLTTDFD